MRLEVFIGPDGSRSITLEADPDEKAEPEAVEVWLVAWRGVVTAQRAAVRDSLSAPTVAELRAFAAEHNLTLTEARDRIAVERAPTDHPA